tara:strand:+ start:9079 stop:9516 length:438 start_codon:yes stop_codon:yes gene_type:complete
MAQEELFPQGPDGFDPVQYAQSEGFPDPMGDIFLAGQQEQHKGLIREMLSPGDTEEERYVRLRTDPKDISDYVDFAYEEEFIKNRGRPDQEKLATMEQLMQVGLYGEARHEAIMMYTRIMTAFPGPGKWMARAKQTLGRRSQEPG